MIQNINGYHTKEGWLIGKGSFASVYKAEKGGHLYALKIFQTDFLNSELSRERINHEIKALQKIKHPNVVRLYDHGIFTDQGFEYIYLVMDIIEGDTLTKYIGGLHEDGAVDLIKNILTTLDVIHGSGIVHRDLKPQNIMISKQGLPIILDFGLAKLIDYTSITQTGTRLGSYSYMSPEQVTDSHNLTAISDYFAVGVIFYELITGRLPYDATNLPALIEQIKNNYPVFPSKFNPTISEHIEDAILKLLEKQPYQRYQKVSEIIAALDAKQLPRTKKLDLSIKHILRVLNNETKIVEIGVQKGWVERIQFPANLFLRFKGVTSTLTKLGIPFLSDPATNRLTYPAFSKTEGVIKLPYASGNDVNPLQKKDFESISKIQTFVGKVLEYQIQYGVNELEAPFFFMRGINDDFFDINLQVLKESIRYRDEHYSGHPIWGSVCMNINDWYDDSVKNSILNRYTRYSPDGFLVYGDPVNNQSSITQLFHYVDLLLKLENSTSAPVIACRVNGIGLILLAIGITGISSGVSALDNFDENILSDASEGYAAPLRYYIPELLSMVSLEKDYIATKLRDIGNTSIGNQLKCPCDYCKTIYTHNQTTWENVKLHFLLRKKQQIDSLIQTPKADRIDYVVNLIDQAISYEKVLRNENVKILNDISYLRTWRDLALKFKA